MAPTAPLHRRATRLRSAPPRRQARSGPRPALALRGSGTASDSALADLPTCKALHLRKNLEHDPALAPTAAVRTKFAKSLRTRAHRASSTKRTSPSAAIVRRIVRAARVRTSLLLQSSARDT